MGIGSGVTEQYKQGWQPSVGLSDCLHGGVTHWKWRCKERSKVMGELSVTWVRLSVTCLVDIQVDMCSSTYVYRWWIGICQHQIRISQQIHTLHTHTYTTEEPPSPKRTSMTANVGDSWYIARHFWQPSVCLRISDAKGIGSQAHRWDCPGRTEAWGRTGRNPRI